MSPIVLEYITYGDTTEPLLTAAFIRGHLSSKNFDIWAELIMYSAPAPYGVFTLPDKKTDTKTDKNVPYRIYHYVCRSCVGVGQCERTINSQFLY